jgi:putative SOS response-associated peptidase YedK
MGFSFDPASAINGGRRRFYCAVNVQPLQHHHQPSRHRGAFPRDESIRRQFAPDARSVSGLPAPVVRNTDTGRELATMRWGMPLPPRTGGPPVTNIRNTSSPHWRGWPKPENRCLVLANSFA